MYLRKTDLLEKLRGLFEKRNKDTTGLETYKVPVLRQLIKDEEATWVCPACGGPLSIVKWNEQADIITCDKSGCSKYRNPVGTIKK